MTEKKIRMQFHVSRPLAERIADLAETLGRSQSWMCDELLKATLEDRRGAGGWLVWRLGMKLVEAIKGRVEDGPASVYLQVFVEPTTLAEIEKHADKLDQTAARFGAKLLECAVNDHDWLIKLVGRRMGREPKATIEDWCDKRGSMLVPDQTAGDGAT